MSSVETAYPKTLADRLALGPDEHYFPGSWEDFAVLGDRCDYRIEYEDGQIVAMSIASDPHEQLVANLLYALGLAFIHDPEYKRYGSNRHIFIRQTEAAYSPDASMLKGEPEFHEYAKGKTANLNPFLIAEVTSPSSYNRDYGIKLQRYKTIPSLQYILIIDQTTCLVSVYQRLANSDRWQSLDYNARDQSFTIADREIRLADIYANIEFAVKL